MCSHPVADRRARTYARPRAAVDGCKPARTSCMTAQHILVVDDEEAIRGLLHEILEDEGFEVSVAGTIAEAQEARRTRRPDLILLDIWMPDGDGISLLKEWAQGSGLEVPVIMISGHGNVETAVEATRHAAFDFLEKPLSHGKLLVTIE